MVEDNIIGNNMVEDLRQFSRDLANKVIENNIREQREYYIMNEIIKTLEKIEEEENKLINVDWQIFFYLLFYLRKGML